VINKIADDVSRAMAQVRSGQCIAIGGFGRAGIPFNLIDALCDRDLTDLHVISNNAGKDDDGVARLVRERRIGKLTCTFPGHPEFFSQYLAGEVELELVPQGTLAERLRAGGAGLAAFYTPTGAETLLAEGGLPTRYADGRPAERQAAKEVRDFDGVAHVLEHALRPDVALVKAHAADRYGNVRFRLSARNFNPLCAMAARTTIVEAEQVDPGRALDPDDVHLPGAFVSSVVYGARRLDRALAHREDLR